MNSRDDSTNLELESTAKSIGVSYTNPGYIFGDVSDSHAKALNHGMDFLLRKNTTTTNASAIDRLTRDDVLFLLDSDMFLTSPMDLQIELGGSHIWSVMLHGSGNITYCWPNFSVIHFAGLDNGDALLGELDWRTCQRYRGFQSFDSGGCTARFLDYHPEIRVALASKTCTVTAIPKTCKFLAGQNAQRPANDSRCASAHTIEHVGLEDQPKKHYRGGQVYHVGGAGSNWRGCSEDWLRERREDLRTLLSELFVDVFAAAQTLLI